MSTKMLLRKKRECYLALPSIGINIHPQNRHIAPIQDTISEPKLINSPVKLPSKAVANRYLTIDFIVINFNLSTQLFLSVRNFFSVEKKLFSQSHFNLLLPTSQGVAPLWRGPGVSWCRTHYILLYAINHPPHSLVYHILNNPPHCNSKKCLYICRVRLSHLSNKLSKTDPGTHAPGFCL